MSTPSAFPWRIFERGARSHCVLVLNTPIRFEEALAPRLVEIWNGALARVTVDGGTDRWLEWLDATKTSGARPPDLITGDMDSVRPQTLRRFRDGRTQVVRTPDENATDFTKALRQLGAHAERRAVDASHVLVLCDMSGRFDQTVSNVNTLYEAPALLGGGGGARVYLLSATSLIWLLEPGVEHAIRVPRVLRDAHACCGLLPIGGRCRVRTTGLKWNLDDDVLEFGKLVSSSNTYDGISEDVTICTDGHLTWTMEIDAYLRSELCGNHSNKL